MGFFPPVFRYKRLFYLMVPIVVELTFFKNFNPAGLLGPDVKKLKRRWDVANLARLLDHKDPQVKYEAAEALSKIGDRAAGPLIATLQYPDEDVRWKAAIALGEIGNPAAIAPLISLLSDDDRHVRSQAAHALSMIGEPAVPPQIAALKRSDAGIRGGSALALGKIKNPLAVEPLTFLLADEHLMIKAEAASALPLLAPCWVSSRVLKGRPAGKSCRHWGTSGTSMRSSPWCAGYGTKTPEMDVIAINSRLS